MTVQISLFAHSKDNTPHLVEMEWDEFARELGPHATKHQDKYSVPAFSPAVYPAGSARSKRQVTRISFGVLDIDKVSDTEITRLHPLLEGVAHIFYTTWSHAKHRAAGKGWCARLLVQFDRPVQLNEWEAFWPRFNARFGSLGDTQCKDPSRLYFAPACLPNELEQALYHVSHGEPLDVDTLLRTPLAVEAEPVAEASPRTEVVREADIKTFASALKRKAQPFYQMIGRRISTAVEGQPFAEPGERDNAIFQMTGVLAEAFPNANSESLAALFAPALSLMGKDCPSVQDLADKLARHQDQLAARTEQQQTERLLEQQRRIRDAFGNGRITPYTDAELQRMAEMHGTDADGLQQRWIIQRESVYYMLLNGEYTLPITNKDAATAAALRDLSPASSAQVELWKVTKEGIRAKTINELMRDYGSVATRTVISLTEQLSRYDYKTRTFVEAPCPLRELEPKFDLEVDTWLEKLGGSQFEILCDWLAVVTDLREPCAALYIDGVPGAGKTLLADALARLWTTSAPTRLNDAMNAFNEAITGCPLVLADETIPKDYRGRVRTEELREFIQARTRSLNRKYMPTATIQGAVRLIITANNRDLLVSQENLTTNDIKAITDRLIYIEGKPVASIYLQSLGNPVIRTFVTKDRVAKHALWLKENRRVERGKRFYVEGTDSSLLRVFTTSSGLRSSVCNWLVSYLLNPQKIEATGQGLIQVHGCDLYVNARCLIENWITYETHEKAPQAGRITRALAGISDGRAKLKDANGRWANFRRIDLENLYCWAEESGYATRESLGECIYQLNNTQSGTEDAANEAESSSEIAGS